jgi:hypothetical protein
METLQATSKTPLIIDLKAVCRYLEPYRYKHQVAAINWLQAQLPYPMFREFTQRWDNATVSPDPLLRLNSYGAAVYELQQMLNKLRHNLVLDGQFGTKTEAAVMQFQRNNRLTVDGIVGNQTWAKLRDLLEPRQLWDMFYKYTPVEKPYQTTALEWLQLRIPSVTLTEFARRWRNPAMTFTEPVVETVVEPVVD